MSHTNLKLKEQFVEEIYYEEHEKFSPTNIIKSIIKYYNDLPHKPTYSINLILLKDREFVRSLMCTKDNYVDMLHDIEVVQEALEYDEIEYVFCTIREEANDKELLSRIGFMKGEVMFITAEESQESDSVEAFTNIPIPLDPRVLYLDSDFYLDILL